MLYGGVSVGTCSSGALEKSTYSGQLTGQSAASELGA